MASSEALAINNSGQIAGFSFNNAIDNSRATVWNGATPSALSNLGGTGSRAYAINNAGQIAGEVNVSITGNDWHASVWSGTTLGTLSPNSGTAYAINDTGLVAGASGSGVGTIWNSSTFAQVSNFGGPYQIITAINDAGTAVGADLYTPMVFGVKDLPTLGGLGSIAEAINQPGKIVGYSWTPGNNSYHAVLWDSGNVTDLGVSLGISSRAFGINSQGQIVGDVDIGAGGQHATLWNGTTATDLNTFLDASTINEGWRLAVAYGINDSGSIVGIARNDFTGSFQSFLLSKPNVVTPVPEPETYAMLLGGLGLLGFARQYRKQKARKTTAG
jgi:probable HAF family extracellular repeat protein